uniref:Uncharacterized protein n=1 Tax=Peronospora matthiolae TaxID=2874970 RepID=A0AAV1UTT2_9STRA
MEALGGFTRRRRQVYVTRGEDVTNPFIHSEEGRQEPPHYYYYRISKQTALSKGNGRDPGGVLQRRDKTSERAAGWNLTLARRKAHVQWVWWWHSGNVRI